MRRILIGVSAALVLAAGGVAAVALFTAPTLAVAQTDEAADTENSKLDRARAFLLEATEHLVPGVISEEQQAAVVDAILDAGVERRQERAEQFREKAGHIRDKARRLLGGAVAVAAEAIGIETDALVSAVREEGKTIAEVAEANGVDAQVVIDELVAAAEAAIDEKVAASDRDIDPERLAMFKERLGEWAERFVNARLGDWRRFGGEGTGVTG